MYDLLIEDATIVSPRGRQVADVAIEDGVIAYVGSRPFGRAREKMSAIGKFLIPGLIDGHVSASWDTEDLAGSWARTSEAAAVGGVTTLLDVGYRGAPVSSVAELKKRRRAAKASSVVNYGFWASPSNIGRVEALLKGGAVGVQLALPLSKSPPEELLNAFLSLSGVPLSVVAGQASAEPLGASVQASEAAEAIETLIRLADSLAGRAHLSQLSSAEELRRIDPLRRDLPITLGVSIHHLFLSRETTEDHPLAPFDTFPPLRDESDRRSLWTAVKRGRVDTVSSAHVGLPSDLRTQPPGLPGLRDLLGLLRASIEHGRLGLERLVELVCARPAEIFGLDKKGRIEEGCDADLVLFSEERPSPCGAPASTWTPFLGRESAPAPDLVFIAGERVAERGALVRPELRGREVARA